jgi:DNA-binding GntR family transcriptional regulator
VKFNIWCLIVKSKILSFSEEERESLEVRGARVLRDAIIAGEFTPDVLLHVSEVAALLQLSSTPVLGALKRLEAEGYVTIVPRRGFYVRELTLDDLEQITVMRAALESYGVAKGAKQVTAENLEYMQLRIEMIEELLTTGSPSPSESARVAQLDEEFHVELIKAANSPSLLANVLSFRDRGRAYLSLCQDYIMPEMHLSQNTHVQILQACKDRDYTRAEVLTREHILQTTKILEPVLTAELSERNLIRDEAFPSSRDLTEKR